MLCASGLGGCARLLCVPGGVSIFYWPQVRQWHDTYLSVYTRVYTRSRAFASTRACLCTPVCTHVYVYVCTFVHFSLCVHVLVHVCLGGLTCVQNVEMCVHACYCMFTCVSVSTFVHVYTGMCVLSCAPFKKDCADLFI